MTIQNSKLNNTKYLIVILMLLFGMFGLVRIFHAATTYYVATTGSDSNSGTSTAPFKTIQKAADIVNPGDTVIVRDGTYTDTNGDGYVVILNRSGSAGSWVTFKSENKWKPVLDGQKLADYCFMVGNSGTSGPNYINIEDFEVKNCIHDGIMANSNQNDIRIFRNHVHDIARICVPDVTTTYGHDCIDVGSKTSNVNGTLWWTAGHAAARSGFDCSGG